jgi:hypothetical protein
MKRRNITQFPILQRVQAKKKLRGKELPTASPHSEKIGVLPKDRGKIEIRTRQREVYGGWERKRI